MLHDPPTHWVHADIKYVIYIYIYIVISPKLYKSYKLYVALIIQNKKQYRNSARNLSKH